MAENCERPPIPGFSWQGFSKVKYGRTLIALFFICYTIKITIFSFREILQFLVFASGINVWISRVDAALMIDGLDRKRLWLEVQNRLLCAGVPVPNQQGWGQKTPLFPCLGVVVHSALVQVPSPFYVFSLEGLFVQQINQSANPSATTMRMMWCREATGEARNGTDAQGFDWSDLYKTAVSLVDQFLQECQGLLGADKLAMGFN